MPDDGIPIGFKMPEELWILVNRETGVPIRSDEYLGSFIITPFREQALHNAAIIDMSQGFEAVPVQIYPRPTA